ncbi:MAG TPA: hypothetical protein VHE81_08720 [Lacipirellulaceae bacterium]|nr:hypothetical protein [Lacipirellulaceae bacterium]
MLSNPQREYVGRVAHTLQIIVGTMAVGVLMFVGVVFILASQNAPIGGAFDSIITYVAIGMAIAVTIAWMIVPGTIVGRMRQSVIERDVANWGLVRNIPNLEELGDVAPLAAIYQTRTIVGAALFEGAAFLATVAYMIEHQRIALFIAAVLLLLILSQIPTVSRLGDWIESELVSIQQMREMQ